MIPEYINNWIYVLEYMSMDNTYKVAWGKAILECVDSNKYYNENLIVKINFDDIANNMIKYYWDQTFFFHLKQSPYQDKEPVILSQTKKLIDIYKLITGNIYPLWYDKAIVDIKKNKLDDYVQVLKKVAMTMHENVSHRFMNSPKGKINLYGYEKKVNYITFTLEQINCLKEYNHVLVMLFNYKWSQKLEQFNYSPKIVDKVIGVNNSTIRRNALTKYKNLLLENLVYKKPIDFYTNEEIDNDDISIDHVIPWSFIYSDDIWNLVITTKSNNSKKSNMIPSIDIVNKLKNRNKKLYQTIKDIKYKSILKEGIDNNYVDKFYQNCKNNF